MRDNVCVCNFSSRCLGVRGQFPLVHEVSLEREFMALEIFWKLLFLGGKDSFQRCLFLHLFILKCLQHKITLVPQWDTLDPFNPINKFDYKTHFYVKNAHVSKPPSGLAEKALHSVLRIEVCLPHRLLPRGTQWSPDRSLLVSQVKPALSRPCSVVLMAQIPFPF